MKRLTCSQVVATVFALGWTSCPMLFAIERGKQEGKRVAREVLTRAVGAVRADSLLGQFGNMDIGKLSTSVVFTATATVSKVFTLERPEGTYVFSNMLVVNNNVSGNVAMLDPTGQKVIDIAVSQVAFINDNTINFDIASLPTADAPAVTAVGSMTGIQSDPGTAMISVSANGSDTVLLQADFGSAAAQAVASAGSVSPITVTSFPALQQGQGGVAFSWSGLCGIVVGAIVGVLVGAVIPVTVATAIFIGATCLAFGWFGCGM